MNEHEAWLYLADLWRNASQAQLVKVNGLSRSGICGCVSAMEGPDHHTKERMRRALTKEAARLGRDLDWYIWPISPEGSQQRAAFCERMAKATNPIAFELLEIFADGSYNHSGLYRSVEDAEQTAYARLRGCQTMSRVDILNRSTWKTVMTVQLPCTKQPEYMI